MNLFSFGRGDDEVDRDFREIHEIECSLFTPPGGLYLHKILWFLEDLMTKDTSKAPANIRRHDELVSRNLRTLEGAFNFGPMDYAEFDGVWFLIASGQGPILVGCTTDQERLDAILAKEPWEGCQASDLFGYGGEGVRGYGRKP